MTHDVKASSNVSNFPHMHIIDDYKVLHLLNNIHQHSEYTQTSGNIIFKYKWIYYHFDTQNQNATSLSSQSSHHIKRKTRRTLTNMYCIKGEKNNIQMQSFVAKWKSNTLFITKLLPSKMLSKGS
jgi:hypothetical protein